jgi:chromosome segregation ATPase
MTEKERLDQLEPMVADIALKQDRMLGQIGMIVDQVSLHTVRLDDLTRRVTSSEKKIDSLANGLANVTIDLNETRQEMRQRFNQFEQRFDKVDLRFDKVDLRFDKLETRLEKMDQTQELILMLLKEHLK